MADLTEEEISEIRKKHIEARRPLLAALNAADNALLELDAQHVHTWSPWEMGQQSIEVRQCYACLVREYD